MLACSFYHRSLYYCIRTQFNRKVPLVHGIIPRLQRIVKIDKKQLSVGLIQQRRGRHSFAITRQIPDSFQNAISIGSSNKKINDVTNNDNFDPVDITDEDDDGDDDVIDLTRAKEQHQLYVQALRTCVPVLDLPALQSSSRQTQESNDDRETSSTSSDVGNHLPQHEQIDYPDCTFVEDTVIAIGTYALITRLGHISRRGEGDAIHAILQQLGMETLNMNEYYNSTEWRYGSGDSVQGELAIVDGGDVLYTGRHIYVGLSNRTNIEGALFIKQYFASYDVIVVPQIPMNPSSAAPLHLKSAVTHIDTETLLAPMGPYGDQLLNAMNVKEHGYKVHRVPDLLSCNAVTCNGQVIVQDTLCERSQDILYQAVMETDQDLILVDTSELAKKDGALTCCSILLEI